MALYKRGDVFYIKITHPWTGRAIRRSTRTSSKRKAQEVHDRVKTQLWDEARGTKPPRLWKEAVVQWITEREHKRDLNEDRRKLAWLDPHFGELHLHEITRDVIEAVVIEKSTPSTRNRYRAVIRAILRAAEREWEWIDRAPAIRMEKEPPRRVRYLTRAEFERLASHLPKHLAAMARFAVSTGVRASNVTGLKWSQVDLVRRVAWFDGRETKNAEPLGVYLNDEAVAAIRSQLGRHRTLVFTYKGEAITQPSTKAWYRALKKAGIEDFRWHDLRHTWASWHVQHGTPLYALQEQGGWKSPQMVRRYAHLSAEHFKEHGDRIVGTKLDTSKNADVSEGGK